MSVTNRALNSDIQKRAIHIRFPETTDHGHSGILTVIPFNCVLNKIQLSSYSQDGNPFLQLSLLRFIPGYGSTRVPLTSTFTIPIYGTSGFFDNGVSLNLGASYLNLQTNDVLHFVCAGAPTSSKIYYMLGCLLVTPVQDVVKYFGEQ